MPDPTALETLKNSDKPAELARACQTLASSDEPALHTELRAFLTSARNLDRLDPPAKVVRSAFDLYAWRPLRTLMDHEAPVARETVAVLVASKEFPATIDRTDLALEASVVVRPPTPGVLTFWRTCADPKGVHINMLARVLADNATDASIGVFEELIAEPQNDEHRRQSWLLAEVPRHRNNPVHLRSMKRLILATRVAVPVRLAALQAVVDWDDEWGPIHGPDVTKPPARALASKEARDLTREVIKLGMDTLSPDAALKAKAQAVVAELDVLEKK